MSDNIPFEIQLEIIKKVSNVKSLIQFRSVSKPWKAFIDSHQFIKGYGTRDTQPHSRMLPLFPGSSDGLRYICLVDDDIETFKLREQEVKFVPSLVSPLLNQYSVSYIVGTCHGLLCLYGFHRGYEKWMVVIWNPSIQKAFGIVVPSFGRYSNNKYDYAFGVCPVTGDPIVVKIFCGIGKPQRIEVFTLGSGVWNVIPCGKMLRESVNLNTHFSTHVVINGFIYWGAWEKMHTDEGETTIKHMVVSFDLITKGFEVVDLPDALSKKLSINFSVSKLRECLVVYGAIIVEGAVCCGVWVMEHDSSFRELFTIATGVHKILILGFRKGGEPIFITLKRDRMFTTLDLYDPSSQQIKNLGISGEYGSFFMGFNKESLLLLNHADSHIYSDDS